MRWCTMPSCIHQTFSAARPWMPVDAKGAPLSVRMASGNPTARKSARKTGLASTVFTECRPWQASTRRLK